MKKIIYITTVKFFNKTIGLCVPRADMYGIRFPDNATNEAKMMLIYATIFLDYLQYWA